MKIYTPGQFYPFTVMGLVEINETKYLSLTDGEVDTFKVQAFDYQHEWESANMPPEIQCYVKKINIWGQPYLAQSRKQLLESCYLELGTEYAFKVLSRTEDENTKMTYYELKDPFGISHRYYPKSGEPERQVSDIFSLRVDSIEDKGNNKVFLVLSYPADAVKSEEVVLVPTQVTRTQEKAEIGPLGTESQIKEFKSSIVYPAGSIQPDIDKQMLIILKTIAGFQNAQGGELYLGVNDLGNVCGIQEDLNHLNTSKFDEYSYPLSLDGYELKIRNAVKYSMNGTANRALNFQFKEEDGKDYVVIQIEQVNRPVFVNGTKLFQRAGNMTQLLKGDEITYFIEQRLRLRNAPIQTIELPKEEESSEQSVEIQLVQEQEATYPSKETNTASPKPEGNAESVWMHFTVYKTGEWSYQKQKLAGSDIHIQVPIYPNTKDGRLLFVYANGCVNSVIPKDVFKGKTRNKKYSNGLNKDSELLQLFCVEQDTVLVFKSQSAAYPGHYYKVHRTTDISDHSSLHAKGNVLINKNLQVQLVEVTALPIRYAHLVSDLQMKSNQTSNTKGYHENLPQLRNTFKTLKELLEVYGEK